MKRIDIINIIGKEYLTTNIEEGGFSYKQVIEDKEYDFGNHWKLDIRFEDTNSLLSILVETKNKKFSPKDKKQLFSYITHEQKYRPNHNIIAILARTDNTDEIKVWKNKAFYDIESLSDETIKSVTDYISYFKTQTINDEITIKTAVLELNELLHKNSIPADIRGQFVGTCLLALKSPQFIYKTKDIPLETSLIIQGIKNVIGGLLNDDVNRAQKIALLDAKVLNEQKIRNIKSKKFGQILDFVNHNIIPFINTETTQGQDLLNLFFTTFNKYVGKKDKNQAFTPDHITHFMCKVAGVNKHSKVLDPTCGSGSFIVQALIQELNECNTFAEKDQVKKCNIFGIENTENIFGLATTNMLIHGDGNSNVLLDSCFSLRDWIQDKNIDIVLMNPPYNAQPNEIPDIIRDNNKKEVYRIHNWNKKQKDGKADPTKGFCFVNYIADCVGKDKNGNKRTGAKLLCLLPLSCAIGSKEVIKEEKIKILKENTLEAVFTLPAEMFYPGASVNACCMMFTIGIPHFTKTTNEENEEVIVPRKETFFGYFKDDGFTKKKNLGRISKIDKQKKPIWKSIENYWLDLFWGNKTDKFLAIKRKVTAEDEWLAEAYIDTDYSKISEKNFKDQLQKYFAYLVGHGYDFYNKLANINNKNIPLLDINLWHSFLVQDILKCDTTKHLIDTEPGKTPYVTRSALNNGVTDMISDADYKPNLGNCITIGAEGAVAFYQPEEFISGVKIYTLRNNKLNKYNALFICACLNLETFRYAYGRARILDKIKTETIKLPAQKSSDGSYEPDWEYMENYIKSLPYADLI